MLRPGVLERLAGMTGLEMSASLKTSLRRLLVLTPGDFISMEDLARAAILYGARRANGADANGRRWQWLHRRGEQTNDRSWAPSDVIFRSIKAERLPDSSAGIDRSCTGR